MCSLIIFFVNNFCKVQKFLRHTVVLFFCSKVICDCSTNHSTRRITNAFFYIFINVSGSKFGGNIWFAVYFHKALFTLNGNISWAVRIFASGTYSTETIIYKNQSSRSIDTIWTDVWIVSDIFRFTEQSNTIMNIVNINIIKCTAIICRVKRVCDISFQICIIPTGILGIIAKSHTNSTKFFNIFLHLIKYFIVKYRYSLKNKQFILFCKLFCEKTINYQ